VFTEKNMSKRTTTVGSVAFTLLALSSAVSAQNLTAKARSIQPQPVIAVAESDRTRDGLVGPVRRVRTETAKLSNESGKQTESKRVTLETAAYDLKGNKTENQYFPIAGATLTGKEVYRYDEKGNISEMTLLNSDGSLMGREVYKYEYDFAGNWNKMTTSVAVVESGKLTFEPTEVTYRSLMYYLDEKMLKTVQPEGAPAIQPAPANNAANVARVNIEPKTQPIIGKPANRKTSTALPLPTVSGSSLDGAIPMEVKTFGVNANSNVPVVLLDSEPPAGPTPRPILKPVSGGVLNGTALSLPAPNYPEAAKRLRASGIVSVDVILDESGKVISATASSGPSMLRDVAVQAALKARFSPTKLSGQPVKVAGVINYKFALTQ
jgi:TonB family protein